MLKASLADLVAEAGEQTKLTAESIRYVRAFNLFLKGWWILHKRHVIWQYQEWKRRQSEAIDRFRGGVGRRTSRQNESNRETKKTIGGRRRKKFRRRVSNRKWEQCGSLVDRGDHSVSERRFALYGVEEVRVNEYMNGLSVYRGDLGPIANWDASLDSRILSQNFSRKGRDERVSRWREKRNWDPKCELREAASVVEGKRKQTQSVHRRFDFGNGQSEGWKSGDSHWKGTNVDFQRWRWLAFWNESMISYPTSFSPCSVSRKKT